MKKQMKTIAAALIGTSCITSLVLLMTSATPAETPSSQLKISTVNFKNCLENSKFGKQQQARFKEMDKQFQAQLEAKEKEMSEMEPKFKDEYFDTLSPQAGDELKQRYQMLHQERSLLQNQYYQTMTEANGQIIQSVLDAITAASAPVAKQKGLDMILNDDVCVYRGAGLDVSALVIAEMDNAFDKEQSKTK